MLTGASLDFYESGNGVEMSCESLWISEIVAVKLCFLYFQLLVDEGVALFSTLFLDSLPLSSEISFYTFHHMTHYFKNLLIIHKPIDLSNDR